MGWRPGKEEGTLGSLILGLYDEDGELRDGRPHLGLQRQAEARAAGDARALRDGRARHGEPSRWASERELEWVELRPELVVEVTFDHASNDRIRHGAKIARWREDKAAGGVHGWTSSSSSPRRGYPDIPPPAGSRRPRSSVGVVPANARKSRLKWAWP